jgi:hypothetical protein
VTINQEQTFNKFVQQIIKRTKIPNPVIIKRNFSHSSPIQVFRNEDTKKLIELRFFNGINIYVEEL